MSNYLETLSITGFQSLKNVKLGLHPGLNVILGQSDVGKSAVLRAIRTVARGGPATGLVTQGTTSLGVTATFSDNQTVKVTKGKESSFALNGKKYSKVGINVPDEVTELWALPESNGVELCLTTQHDKPYLLDEPASTVAKVLGDLTNASMLMEAVREANKSRTWSATDAKKYEAEIGLLTNKIKEHTNFSARRKAIEKARALYDAALTNKQEADKLATILQQYEDTTTKLEFLVFVDYSKFHKALALLRQQFERIESLAALVTLVGTKKALYTLQCEAETTVLSDLTAIREELDELKGNVYCPECGQLIQGD